MLDFFGFFFFFLKQSPAVMLDFFVLFCFLFFLFFGNKVTQNWMMSAKRVGLGKLGYFK